jgi:hypothetical protein
LNLLPRSFWFPFVPRPCYMTDLILYDLYAE